MAEWWTVDLLDAADYKLDTISRVRGGKLDWSIFRAVWGSGTLDMTASTSGVQPNWLSDRVKVWHHVDGRDPRPYGIWLPKKPGREVDGNLVRYTLTLVDKSDLLNKPTGRYATYAAGSTVVPLVRGIAAAYGENAAVDDSTETLRVALNFEPTDTWLTVANKLLDAIGYTPLHADLNGLLRASKYIAPEKRVKSATYGPGQADLRMRPQWSDEANIAEVPNIVYVYTQGNETTPALIGTARNDNPADPLSTVNRGEVVRSPEQVEATSQDAADSIALKRLHESQQVVRRATITHPVDWTELNEVVEHAPAAFTGAIVQRGVTLGLGACVEDSVRRIYTAGEDLLWI